MKKLMLGLVLTFSIISLPFIPFAKGNDVVTTTELPVGT